MSEFHLKPIMASSERKSYHNSMIPLFRSGKVSDIQMKIVPATGQIADEQFVSITMKFHLEHGYPAVAPKISFLNPRGISQVMESQLVADCVKRLEVRNIGDPILYELIEVSAF